MPVRRYTEWSQRAIVARIALTQVGAPFSSTYGYACNEPSPDIAQVRREPLVSERRACAARVSQIVIESWRRPVPLVRVHGIGTF